MTADHNQPSTILLTDVTLPHERTKDDPTQDDNVRTVVDVDGNRFVLLPAATYVQLLRDHMEVRSHGAA